MLLHIGKSLYNYTKRIREGAELTKYATNLYISQSQQSKQAT